MPARESDIPAIVQRCLTFLREIGLEVREVVTTGKSFLPAVRIRAGGLDVEVARAHPGDILHEAGHLAVIPPPFRANAEDDLASVQTQMGEYLLEHPEGLMSWPEDFLCRGLLQADEQEAQAWQYAAMRHLGLPDWCFAPKQSFEGNLDEVVQRLAARAHVGINGLRAAGWTGRCTFFPDDVPYPRLRFWLHPGALACTPASAPPVAV